MVKKTSIEYVRLIEEQNATLIEQNRKLRDELEWCLEHGGFHNSDWFRINNVLKETEHEK